MDKIIGIELNSFEEVLRNIVRREMKPIREEIKETLKSRQELILQDKRLYTNQVAEMLGVTRHTVLNYRKNGELPEPKKDLSGHPYWAPDEIEVVLLRWKTKAKFPV